MNEKDIDLIETVMDEKEFNIEEWRRAKAVLRGDFKIQAYAKGADGISNITVEKNSALMENCWYMLEGKAKMFMLSNK